MRARILGFVVFLVGAGGWLLVKDGLLSARLIVAVPLLMATGGWMTVFGQPIGKDGIAPAWWRLGLVCVAIASCLAMCQALG